MTVFIAMPALHEFLHYWIATIIPQRRRRAVGDGRL
jgi:hypothetical protein